MHKRARIRLGATLAAGWGPWLVGLAGLFSSVAFAGEVESLAWQTREGAPAVQIRINGDAPYRIDSLEAGRRLRVSFPGSTQGPSLEELPGRGGVKGVYPYLAENGTGVNVDLLLADPGSLDVQKTEYGYVVTPLVGTQAASPAGAAPNTIQDIVYAKLPGDRVQVTLRMTRPPEEPNTFSTTNPPRVALDFVGTRVGMAAKSMNVRMGAISNITAIEAEGRTRVVLSLIKPVPYSTSVDGSNFVVTVAAPTSAIAGAEQPKTTHFASSRKSGKYSIQGIDFRRGPQGDGKIIINLSDPAVGIDMREQAGEIVLDFLNTSIPAELQRRLDVVDFATPVQTIDTFRQGMNTRMVITPKGRYEHMAFQAGSVFTVDVKPVIEKEAEKKVDEFGYSGEKLSLNFQNIDVRAALQVLADFTGINFVVSDTVKGNLTLRLKDVPWDQALDIIVDAKNLAARRKGNVITVAPAAEVAAKEKAALEAAKATVELEPLVSELIQINYAKAQDIADLLKSIRAITNTTITAKEHPVFGSVGTGSQTTTTSASNTLLSPRGQVTVDERTNSILIQDTPGKIREVRKLIAQLDQPVRQVMIETRLVEATDNYVKNLGVKLGHLTDRFKGKTETITTGNLSVIPGLKPPDPDTVPVFEIEPGGLNVNLPGAGVGSFPAGALTLTFFRGSNILDLELSALEQEGNGKIISSPRIITANQKKASIEQGQERVFTTSVLGAGSVVTKKATLKLEVTPQITPDDRVNLDVVITKDNFADAVQGLLNVKQIKTQVLLDNGETVAIGGIYERDRNETTTKVPFFGDLPLLGWLFRNKAKVDNKTELLVFLTPRILSENLKVR